MNFGKRMFLAMPFLTMVLAILLSGCSVSPEENEGKSGGESASASSSATNDQPLALNLRIASYKSITKKDNVVITNTLYQETNFADISSNQTLNSSQNIQLSTTRGHLTDPSNVWYWVDIVDDLTASQTITCNQKITGHLYIYTTVGGGMNGKIYVPYHNTSLKLDFVCEKTGANVLIGTTTPSMNNDTSEGKSDYTFAINCKNGVQHGSYNFHYELGGNSIYATSVNYTANFLCKPTLSLPANNTSIVSGSTVKFQWNESFASSYNLIIDPGTANAQIFALNNSTLSYSTNCTKTGNHTWMVESVGYSAGEKCSSDVFNFSIIPNSPTLTSPVNGAIIDRGNNHFSWSSLPEAVSYILTIGGKDYPATGNELTVNFPSYADNVSWYVTAVGNDNTKSAPSQTYLFSINPPFPILVSPDSGRSISGSKVTFTWLSAANAKKYDVYITKPDLSTEMKETTGLNLDYNCASEGNYSWLVKAIDNEGNEHSSTNQYYFTVQTPRPVLDSPADSKTFASETISLQWHPSFGAGYTYKYYITSSDGSVNIAGTTSGTGYSFIPTQSGTYTWKVSLFDNNNENFSDLRTFTVHTGILSVAPALTKLRLGNNASNAIFWKSSSPQAVIYCSDNGGAETLLTSGSGGRYIFNAQVGHNYVFNLYADAAKTILLDTKASKVMQKTANDLMIFDAGKFLLYHSNGSTYSAPVNWLSIIFTTITNYAIGDFNGDGKDDVFYIYSQAYVGTHPIVAFSDGSKLASSSDVSLSLPNCNNFIKVRAADINGDGKDELITEEAAPYYYYSPTFSVIKVYTFANNQFTLLYSVTIPYGTWWDVGDFDGNGKYDLVYFDQGYLKVCTSTGSGFSSPANWISIPTCAQGAAGDFDGDGKDDVVISSYNMGYYNSKNYSLNVFTSSGSSFVNSGAQLNNGTTSFGKLLPINMNQEKSLIGMTTIQSFYYYQTLNIDTYNLSGNSLQHTGLVMPSYNCSSSVSIIGTGNMSGN